MSNFLTLSSEISEPFVIPNVSPISSPKLNAISFEGIQNDASRAMGINFHPVIAHDDDDARKERAMSVLDIN